LFFKVFFYFCTSNDKSAMSVSEILQKEEERHQLVRMGVIKRLQDAIDMVNDVCGQSAFNALDKKSVLRYFYSTVAQYASFIDREKATNITLKRILFRKSSAHLETMRISEPALFDKELKTDPKHTLAYHISDVIFESIYASFCRCAQPFENPDETIAFFLQELKQRYPLYIHAFIEALEQGDTSLWDVTCRYLQKLSYYVVSQYAGTFSETDYYDIICDETWSKAYEVLQKRLIEKLGNVPTFNNGNDFRNYMIKTCRFLAENLYKKYAKKEAPLDELLFGLENDDDGEAAEREESLPFEMEASSEPELFDNYVKELDIDTGNPYEVAYAVSIILLNKEHALHQALVQGVEDKVELLINKAVNDMSYNEIVSASYGDVPDEDEFRRAVAKARKDYERIRKTLTGRLIEIIEKKGKHFVTSGSKAKCFK